MSFWIRLPVLLVVFLAVLVLGQLVVGAADGSPPAALLAGLGYSGLALAAYVMAVRRLERRPVAELRRARAVPETGAGVAAGVGLFTAVIAVIALFGGYRVDGWGSAGGAVTLAGVMAVAAVAEELLFRGVLFRLLLERFGAPVALVVSAVLFGGLHLFNPGATLWGATAIAVEAGLMLGSAFLVTRSLWLPIGLHFGWNFAEAGLFGTTVSGTEGGPAGLLRGVAQGSDVVSGGAFGPEASIVSVVFGAAATVVLLLLARRRDAPVTPVAPLPADGR
ncbi:CPBP family intramembrane glutamic endopeptidase [Dactylosporangium sp. NPDC005555]|uniref:CPBP family intramembrane glutamic endopeptidase n=1 Tax=Dactylosporangium sp. NPDC005555 TaxID=3154889 RepID=UPI0033AE38A5